MALIDINSYENLHPLGVLQYLTANYTSLAPIGAPRFTQNLHLSFNFSLKSAPTCKQCMICEIKVMQLGGIGWDQKTNLNMQRECVTS